MSEHVQVNGPVSVGEDPQLTLASFEQFLGRPLGQTPEQHRESERLRLVSYYAKRKQREADIAVELARRARLAEQLRDMIVPGETWCSACGARDVATHNLACATTGERSYVCRRRFDVGTEYEVVVRC